MNVYLGAISDAEIATNSGEEFGDGSFGVGRTEFASTSVPLSASDIGCFA